MKAYEFYVLLGKYKRGSLSAAEFDKFRMGVDISRRFRYAFQDSTGETRPTLPRYLLTQGKRHNHSDSRRLGSNSGFTSESDFSSTDNIGISEPISSSFPSFQNIDPPTTNK